MMSDMQRPSPSIVLPSIRDMFPEDLMQIPPHIRMAKVPSPRLLLSPYSHGNLLQPITTPGTNRPRSHSDNGLITQPSPRDPMVSSRTQHLRTSTTSPSSALPFSRSFNAYPSSDERYLPPGQNGHERPNYSYEVLQSSPSSASLQHLSSSTSSFSGRGGGAHGHHTQAGIANGYVSAFKVEMPPAQPSPSGHGLLPISPRIPDRHYERVESGQTGSSNYSSIISFPAFGAAHGPPLRREHSPDDIRSVSDDGDLSGSNSGKKHVCRTCSKRFNRPSSLRIHVNTHTGATPFRCPWPSCGREFNVNSNMRRHYRNHTTPGLSRSQSNDTRRRRRHVPHPGYAESNVSLRSADDQRLVTSPPISSLSVTDEEDEEEEDELESPSGASSPGSSHPSIRAHPRAAGGPYLSQRISYSFLSSSRRTTAPSLGSSSSSSPSPPPGPPTYSPSAPYIRSLANSRVSTALRPAFNPAPVHVPVKDEPMPDAW